MKNTVEDIVSVYNNHEILEEWNECIRQSHILELESILRRFKKQREKLEDRFFGADDND